MARMKYVQRRANRFEFRFPLPDDLAGHPHPQPWPDALAWLANPRTGRFKTELIRSLGTNDHRLGDGIAFLDFSDEGEDQNLKNLSSARSMPIHGELVRLGFLDFVAERSKRTGPTQALWVGFEPPIDDKAKAWTKWFGRYLGSHVVEHPSKTFHSFRHTFKRACREAGISEEIHHAFTGHSGGGVGRSYGRVRRSDGSMDRGVSLTRLKLDLDRMSYPGLQLPRRSVCI